MLYPLVLLASLLAGPGPGITPGDTPGDGLVAHYQMSQINGNIARDLTGHGHDATVHGNAKLAGNFLQLDGEDDYLEVDPKIGKQITDAGSLEIWCRPQTLQGGLINFSTGMGWNDQRLVMAFNTYSGGHAYLIVLSDGDSPQRVANVGNLQTNRWTHLVLTYDRQSILAYQDGVLVRTASRDVSPNLADVPMWIGRCRGLGKEHFKGFVDEVRVYNHALKPDTIIQRFKQKARQRGMKVSKYFDQPKLTVSQNTSAGWITAEADYGWMQPLPLGAKLIVSLPGYRKGVEHDVDSHSRIGRVNINVASLKPGNMPVQAVIIGSDGKQIGKPVKTTIKWNGRDPAFANVKVLNNLVWELLDVTKPGQFTFRQPRYRWVWIKATGTNVKVNLNGQSVLTTAGETMRQLNEGEHQLTVAGKVSRLIVRSVPEMIMAEYGSKPLVKPHGPWDRDYYARYILPHHNTLIMGRGTDSSFLDQWRNRGGRSLAHVAVPRAIGQKTISDVETAYNYMAKTAGITDPQYDGVIADEFGSSEPHCALYAKAYDRMRLSSAIGNKLFYPYANDLYNGEEGRELIRSVMRAHAGIASKHYLKTQPSEQAARDFIDSTILRRGREYGNQVPGSIGSVVVCFGYFSAPPEFLHQHPQVNYKKYLDMQFRAVATDPAYFGALGMMTYLARYSDDETVRWGAKLMRHYGIEGNTGPATKEPYLSPHIINGDFMDGTTTVRLKVE